MAILIIGFDSAWTAHKEGALVAVILYPGSRKMVLVQSPVAVDWSSACTSTTRLIAEHSPSQTLIYIDQPTIVSNATGQRPVENIIGSVISYHYGGMQPSSLKRSDMFGPQAPITEFVRALKADTSIEGETADIRVIETYPTLTLITQNWLCEVNGLSRPSLPKYNPENRKNFKLSDWKFVCMKLAETMLQEECKELSDILLELGKLTMPRKRDQDYLDACLCLLTAFADINNRAMYIGNTATGFITAPFSPEIFKRLEIRCEKTGKSPSAWLSRPDQATSIREGSLTEVVAVIRAIPELNEYSLAKLQERLASRPFLALVAVKDDKPIGFKLGYESEAGRFYSWIGGVVPKYRRQGIAQKLLDAQETWASENGYKFLDVKSMNRFPHMLQMLVKNDYLISGYVNKGTPLNSKICFSKALHRI